MPRNKRSQPEIDASSMADIAFLLLVFWLSITTVLTVQGLPEKLENKEDAKDLPEEQEQEINAQFLLVIQQKASKAGADDCNPDNLGLQVEYSYSHGDEISSEAARNKDISENASIFKDGSELLDESTKREVGNKTTWDYQPVQLGSDELNVIKEIVANHIRKQKGEHIIQFKYKDGVCYQNYMTMFQTIEAAYEEVRNETSQEMYGIGWDELKVKASKEPKTKEDLNRPNGWREKEANIYKLVSTSKLSKQVVN